MNETKQQYIVVDEQFNTSSPCTMLSAKRLLYRICTENPHKTYFICERMGGELVLGAISSGEGYPVPCTAFKFKNKKVDTTNQYALYPSGYVKKVR